MAQVSKESLFQFLTLGDLLKRMLTISLFVFSPVYNDLSSTFPKIGKAVDVQNSSRYGRYPRFSSEHLEFLSCLLDTEYLDFNKGIFLRNRSNSLKTKYKLICLSYQKIFRQLWVALMIPGSAKTKFCLSVILDFISHNGCWRFSHYIYIQAPGRRISFFLLNHF